MKSTVNFYSLDDVHDINICICQLVRKLYKTHESVIIIDEDNELEKLNKLLWTFEQNSFLPHKIYENEDKLDTPIILLSEKYIDNENIFDLYSCAINNHSKPLLKEKNDINVYEFVVNNEAKKEQSRIKYAEYKRNNYMLKHNKYNEQTI